MEQLFKLKVKRDENSKPVPIEVKAFTKEHACIIYWAKHPNATITPL